MAADASHEAFQRVLTASHDRLLKRMTARLRSHPDAARHGVADYLKPVETGRDRTALRQQLHDMGQGGDAGQVEMALAQLINERGMQGLTALEMSARPGEPVLGG